MLGQPLTYQLGTPGRHVALNSLGVLAAAHALGADRGRRGAGACRALQPPAGRGERTVLTLGGRRGRS